MGLKMACGFMEVYYQFSWICIKSDNKLFIEVKWNLWSIKNFEIEVIGNIFDDKELEKGE
jgi:hypothetical protein